VAAIRRAPRVSFAGDALRRQKLLSKDVMTKPMLRNLSTRQVLSILTVMGTVAVVGPILAQSAPPPAFDVTSIKPNNTSSRGISLNPTPNGGMLAENVTAGLLIRVGFQIQDKQIVGGPKWLFEDRYNIVSTGTSPGGREGTFYEKLKTLLADRFKLVTHTEKREQPVLALVRARADGALGPKMSVSKAECSPNGAPTPRTDPRCGFNFGVGKVLVVGQTTESFAGALGISIGDFVVDRTGLTGLYDFDLSYAPNATVNSDLPSVFAAVQEQLGLRLEATRGPVDVLVIDGMEQPTPD
jgi:uncharacterized protein (TIGR03435 family)